jgi:hypothetical protein
MKDMPKHQKQQKSIMVNMSEDWRESIVEAKVYRKTSTKKSTQRSGARLKRYDGSKALALKVVGNERKNSSRSEQKKEGAKKK